MIPLATLAGVTAVTGRISGGRLRRRVSATVAALLLAAPLGGCAFGPPDPSEQQGGTPPKLPSPSASGGDDGGASVSVIAKNLSVPWGIAFLPDGSSLITERDNHRILKMPPTGGTTTPVQTIADAVPGGEGGLLGIAVSPHYAQDASVFVYYSTATDNRIAKLTLGGTPVPIVTGIPHSGQRDGGALAFGPDGYLYAGTGDAEAPDSSQNAGSLAGKILRMAVDGKPAPGNPAGTLVYASGLRNVQGLAWDQAGRLYATDFGQDKFDEINLIQAGGNYGWPSAEGPATGGGSTNPLATFPPAQASCAGAATSGAVLVTGCLAGKRIWLVQLDGKGGVLGQPQHTLDNQFGRLRAVVRAPDNTLWVSTSNKDGRGTPGADDDRILRIVVSGGDKVDRS